MVELFNVTTTIKQFHGCKDVRMEWLVIDRKMPVAVYAEVIRDYPTGADKEYAEACADELFTGEEARALMAYLDSHEGVHSVSPAKLPIEPGSISPGVLGVRGPEGFYRLCEEDMWNLPFKVWGYYDLRRHESALGGELERRRAFRRGTMFMSNEGIVHASELTDEEYRQYVKGSGLPDFDDVDDTFTRQ